MAHIHTGKPSRTTLEQLPSASGQVPGESASPRERKDRSLPPPPRERPLAPPRERPLALPGKDHSLSPGTISRREPTLPGNHHSPGTITPRELTLHSPGTFTHAPREPSLALPGNLRSRSPGTIARAPRETTSPETNSLKSFPGDYLPGNE